MGHRRIRIYPFPARDAKLIDNLIFFDVSYMANFCILRQHISYMANMANMGY